MRQTYGRLSGRRTFERPRQVKDEENGGYFAQDPQFSHILLRPVTDLLCMQSPQRRNNGDTTKGARCTSPFSSSGEIELERQLQSGLPYARRHRSHASDLAEVAATWGCIRVREVRVVERVEHIPAKLQIEALLEDLILHQSKIAGVDTPHSMVIMTIEWCRSDEDGLGDDECSGVATDPKC